MMRIAVCDKDIDDCLMIDEILHKLQKKYSEKIKIKIFHSRIELQKNIMQGATYHLIFFHVGLKAQNEIERNRIMGECLRDKNTYIVYLTDNIENIQMSKQKYVLDVLIKPIERVKLEKVFDTSISLVWRESPFFEYCICGEVSKMPCKDIYYFESAEKKVTMITDNREMTFYGKLSCIFSKLNKKDFIRIHKSYLVNYNYIKEFQYYRVILTNGEILPISQSKRPGIKKQMKETKYKEIRSVYFFKYKLDKTR